MTILGSLFGESPFGPLVKHAEKVKEVLDLFPPVVQSFIDSEFEKLRDLQNEISLREHEADEIRNEVRTTVTRAMFLPVNRGDLLGCLHQQDGIADSVEDVSVVLTLKRTVLHPDLVPLFKEFADKACEAAECLLHGSTDLGDLLDAGFDGPVADHIIQVCDSVGQFEWETDRIQRRLLRRLYELEGEVSPFDLVYVLRLARNVGDIANHAENTGNYLMMMAAR